MSRFTAVDFFVLLLIVICQSWWATFWIMLAGTLFNICIQRPRDGAPQGDKHAS